MVEQNFIDWAEFFKTPSQRITIQHKISKSKHFLDIRIWVKWDGQDEFLPTRKGITLRFDEWRKAVPLIQGMLKDDGSI